MQGFIPWLEGFLHAMLAIRDNLVQCISALRAHKLRASLTVLGIVVGSVAIKGGSALNWDFFTKSPALFGQTGGGIAPAIVGTAVLVAWAIAIAVPVGVLTAIYVTEFAPRRVGVVGATEARQPRHLDARPRRVAGERDGAS